MIEKNIFPGYITCTNINKIVKKHFCQDTKLSCIPKNINVQTVNKINIDQILLL